METSTDYRSSSRTPKAVAPARRQHLGLLAFPMAEAGLAPVRNLTAILGTFSSRLVILMGGGAIPPMRFENDVTLKWVDHKAHASILGRVLSYISLQVRMSIAMASVTRQVDAWIFFMCGDTLVLPLLTGKFLRKRIILIRAGSSVEALQAAQDKLAGVLSVLSRWGQRISDRIVIYSSANAYLIPRHEGLDKVFVARHHYVDRSLFRNVVPLGSRGLAVGYLGRLEPEKGIRELLKAIPIIATARPGVRFLIVGDGELRSEVEESLRDKGLEAVVELRGWAPHHEIPRILNTLRIAVLPSYTEGLPNIMVESMACGTPIVATPVGAIPDFIKDGVTGFLVNSNQPEELAKGILRALDHPRLEEIAAAASDLAGEEFSFAKAVERFQNVIGYE